MIPLMVKIIEGRVLTTKHETVLLETERERVALDILLVYGDWE